MFERTAIFVRHTSAKGYNELSIPLQTIQSVRVTSNLDSVPTSVEIDGGQERTYVYSPGVDGLGKDAWDLLLDQLYEVGLWGDRVHTEEVANRATFVSHMG